MIGIKNIFLFSVALLECVAGQPARITGGQPKPLDPTILPCTVVPETRDFRKYHLANRFQYTPVGQNGRNSVFKSPPNLGGLATISVESVLRDSTAQPTGKEIQYKIMIANSDKVSRSAQLAWSANKDSQVPEAMFTVTAKVGQSVEGCIVLPSTTSTKYVTFSGF